ncbi:MAG: alanine:cation symporter family protein [Muribaculaceae bacterium]|nr:alanine:cation symporter family protein [Muribaculaceae bacterium]
MLTTVLTNIFTDIGEWLNTAIADTCDFIWTYLLIIILIGCGLYFTYRLKFFQFRMLGEMFRLLIDSSGSKKGERHITSFQAFAISVATRVGTGNLAGVATAIAIGGPGAVFWMWMIALVGASSAFVESTLAQLYKRRGKYSFIGGPAYYILHGLHKPWMASLFAVLITLTFGLSYNSIQSNTICSAMNEAFGFDPFITGVVIAAVALVIVFGGIRRIANVSSIIVPFMAIGYFLIALVIIILNIDQIPHILRLIVESAFGFGQFAGGAIGITIMNGIKRGLFSNEAGEGSAPNVAATAHVTHPVKQGLVQSLGVFTDTLLVCSCTAFIILISGLYNNPDLNGIVLTQNALTNEIGEIGKTIVAVAVFFFAFSSIIGNYYYGEANIRFLTSKRSALVIFRIFSAGAFVLFGAIAKLNLVWTIGDLCMALLTACNLVAIVLLGKYAFRLLDDYRSQKRRGIKDPIFKSTLIPEIKNDLDAWN